MHCACAIRLRAGPVSAMAKGSKHTVQRLGELAAKRVWDTPSGYSYDNLDSALYSLATGFAQDPLDQHERSYIVGPHQKVSPAALTMFGRDVSWLSDLGIDPEQTAFVGQGMSVHRAVPLAATVFTHTEVTQITSKPDGSIIVVAKSKLHEGDLENAICTNTMTVMVLPPAPSTVQCTASGRARPKADFQRLVAGVTAPNQALLFGVMGDRYPVHWNDEYAVRLGFAGPVLHGLCCFGFACRAVLVGWNIDPNAIGEIDLRFTGPAYPGETIRTFMARRGSEIMFSCDVAERDTAIITDGRVRIVDG